MQHFDGSRLQTQIAVTLLVAGLLATNTFALTSPQATQGNRRANRSTAKAVVPAPREVIGFTPGDDRKLALNPDAVTRVRRWLRAPAFRSHL